MNSGESESLLTVADVSRFLNMSPQWVYKHAELGTLPCVRMGASLRFQPSDVRRYVDKQTQRHQGSSVVPLPRIGKTRLNQPSLPDEGTWRHGLGLFER